MIINTTSSKSLIGRQPTALIAAFTLILATSLTGRQDALARATPFPEVATSHYSSSNSGKHSSSLLQIHKLAPSSNNITCNDGSQVGYYKRLNSESKSWIIYLQGGGFCASEESCQQRWHSTPHLMTSHLWPKTKTVDGILSSEPRDNPYLWSANLIYVPYCSSDSWTGLAPASGDGSGPSFAFMGSRILERVIDSLYDDLPRESSLYDAESILLAGDSAGATGVILNLDKVQAIIEKRASSLEAAAGDCQQASGCYPKRAPMLKGLADSGWFLDNEPYEFGAVAASVDSYSSGASELDSGTDCDRNRCSPSQSIKQAMALWNGQLPQACISQYQAEPWRCYFGYRVYQTLKTPLFVVQWLYDEAQLLVDNIARPDTSGQWNYVNKVVHEMRASLQNVTALFAPSCFSHSLVIKRSWNQININGFKLPHVLHSWEQQSILEASSAIGDRRKVSTLNTGESPTRFVPTSPEQNPTTRQLHHTQTPHQSTVTISAFNQAAADTWLGDQEQPSILNTPSAGDRLQSPSSPDQRILPPKSSGTGSTRTRARKRKRNNQQQQRNKQARHKPPNQSNVDAYSAPQEVAQSASQRESNDLSSTILNKELPPVDRSAQDYLYGRLSKHSTSASSGNGRPGRSTIVDDTTLLLSNNVPDDNAGNQTPHSIIEKDKIDAKILWIPGLMRTHTSVPYDSSGGGSTLMTTYKYTSNTDRFRLIDLCGWPQCNRDCPMLESDFNR